VGNQVELLPERIRLQFKSDAVKKTYIDPLKPLETQLRDSDHLIVKYIGRQIPYRTVFIVEYLGPLIIWFLVHRNLSSIASLMWIFHFCKRLFETTFVHRFGSDTMPLKLLFKNSAYYYFFAFVNAYYSPTTKFVHRDVVWYGNTFSIPVYEQLVPVTLFFMFELSNFYCHVSLRTLRTTDPSGYANPQGLFFKNIACPNYGFEVLSWIAFSLHAKTIAAIAFTFCGFYQINQWAIVKKQRLEATFGKEGHRAWRIMVGW
jgi:very-long-chain enoyl-CoA reductase